MREVEGHQGADHEHQEGPPQRPPRADQVQQPADRRRDEGGQQPGQGDPGVRLHQGQPARQQPGHHDAAHHPVRLGRHQHAQRLGVEREAAVDDRAGHRPGQYGPGQHRGRHGGPAAVRQAVQQRADDGGQQRERGHRDQQVERDPAAGLAGRHREEDRGRQRDRDQHVAERVQRVQFDQFGEARLARALGRGGPADPPAGAVHHPAGPQPGAGGAADQEVAPPGEFGLVGGPGVRTVAGLGRGRHRPGPLLRLFAVRREDRGLLSRHGGRLVGCAGLRGVQCVLRRVLFRHTAILPEKAGGDEGLGPRGAARVPPRVDGSGPGLSPVTDRRVACPVRHHPGRHHSYDRAAEGEPGEASGAVGTRRCLRSRRMDERPSRDGTRQHAVGNRRTGRESTP